eukprot:CAMPEP_0184691208 /NCGR_PEP_ID=MMETSP0313-20130426/112_1 /TAXON_ID=2792 /ORGANISM="Porphyridium aerugineum, Strain SAG 1380-2" /LENGTH=326 /DNA_ID=CAMNT_0027148885 /DNA_START=51 /DNA_END=1031 /DNA_ORIENTATION=+
MAQTDELDSSNIKDIHTQTQTLDIQSNPADITPQAPLPKLLSALQTNIQASRLAMRNIMQQNYATLANQSRIKLNGWASEHPCQAAFASFTALALLGMATTLVARKGWIPRLSPKTTGSRQDLAAPMLTNSHRRKLHGMVMRAGDTEQMRTLRQRLLPRHNIFGLIKAQLKPNRTIHVRLAGVDSTECAQFGLSGPSHATEAIQWLKAKIAKSKHVTIQVLQQEPYQRVIAAVKYKPAEDLSRELIAAQNNVVYGEVGVQYEGVLAKLQAAQQLAHHKKTGASNISQSIVSLKNLASTSAERDRPTLFKSVLRQALLWLSDSSRKA